MNDMDEVRVWQFTLDTKSIGICSLLRPGKSCRENWVILFEIK